MIPRNYLSPISMQRFLPYASARRSLASARKIVRTEQLQGLLRTLSALDTASLCDADKIHHLTSTSETSYHGIRVLEGLQHRNASKSDETTCMVGIARTVQCEDSNDFLAVLQGLAEAEQDEVLVVNTKHSTQAVAGELFCAEAARRGVRGILVDGPMRDTAFLDEFPDVRCYSTSVTPYSGTTQSVGETQVTIECGGVLVSPSDIVVADKDGLVVGSPGTFNLLLETAKQIQETEREIKERVWRGTSLHSLSNYDEHIKARKEGQESTLEFRDN